MKVQTKYLVIFTLLITFNTLVIVESISQNNYGNISVGIGGGHTPNETGLRTYDLNYSNRLKISQGLNIFGEYQYYINKRNSINAGFEISFDRISAKVYEIDNFINSEKIEFETNPNLLRGNFYIGYGYKVFVFKKSDIQVKLDIGYPLFLNQLDSVYHFSYEGSDKFPLPSHGRLELRETQLNLIISPKVLYSLNYGSKKNSLSIYLGYSQMTQKAFHGFSNAEFTGAGAVFTTTPFLYKAIDFGIILNFMLKNEISDL